MLFFTLTAAGCRCDRRSEVVWDVYLFVIDISIQDRTKVLSIIRPLCGAEISALSITRSQGYPGSERTVCFPKIQRGDTKECLLSGTIRILSTYTRFTEAYFLQHYGTGGYGVAVSLWTPARTQVIDYTIA